MTVSPWATKDRVRRLEGRVDDLEAQIEELLAGLDRTTRLLDHATHHLRARAAAADFTPGPRPEPPAWH